MKYIVLSFDDAREDFYTRALPILKRHGLYASVNVISDFVGRQDLKDLASGGHRCTTWEQLEECHAYGIEIANHSAHHKNKVEAVLRCKEALEQHFGTELRGFVSPGSYITAANAAPFLKLKEENQITYIRSGNQIRRDGYFYAMVYLAARWLHSSFLFRLHNRRFVLHVRQGSVPFYPSIMLDAYNTVEQVTHFVESMKDYEAAIFMFHSILDEHDASWGSDKWYNSTTFFDSLCSYLAKAPNTQVVTLAKLHSLLLKQDAASGQTEDISARHV